MPSSIPDMWLAAATWWRLQQQKKVEPDTAADTRQSHLAKVFRCSRTTRDFSGGKILPSHHRITKQATWEPEPWEYRTLDLGHITLICLLCVYVYNLSNNNTSIFKNILLSYFSISLLHDVDLCFKSQTLEYMKERETNYPKWKQPPLEERWGHSLEDTSLTVASQFRFYLGTLASGRKDCFFLTTGIWTLIYLYICLAGCWHMGYRRVSSEHAEVLSEVAKLWSALFFERREDKDKRGERSAGETWLQAAAEWTSNDMTHALPAPFGYILPDINFSLFS